MAEQSRARSPGDERQVRWRAWMVAAQGGDAVAYEKLLFELIPYLRGFARRRMSGEDAVEDAVQTALMSLHRARHTYRGERPFAPWLHAIARNAVIDQLRARSRRTRREVSLEGAGLPEPAAAQAAPGEAPLSPELSAALAALPAGQREAVELIHVHGLSVAEAALRAGVSRAALKVRAHRGYRALRARLGGDPR